MPDWEDVEEHQCLIEAQNGDAESFGLLYTRYAEGIFRYLLVHLDNRLDAEDLTEDVFLRAWKALSQFRPQGIPFSAFLFRIARNALIDFYRRSAREKQLVSLDEADEGQELAVTLGDDPSGQVERRELVSALRSLKAEYRMVIGLRFFSGLSPEETAKVMNRSVGAVRVLQFRALAVIRLKLKNE